MDAVIAVVALIFVLFLVLGVYATVKVVGAAKRGVDRTISQARRTVEDTTLRAKSLAQPGPAGQLAELRLQLRTSMRATQDALHAGVAEDESLKESLGLFQRLSAHGHELDDELRRLESEPDRAKLAERLPALRERTERIIKSADSLRWAAHDRARRFAEDDLDLLSAQIDVEAGALRHWTTEPTPPTPPTSPASPGAPTGAQGPPPAAAPSWPDARAPETADSTGQTWQDTPRSRTAEEPTRPAITPPDPRPTYPWQKKPRPESTT
ncbi:hypothetical protein ACFS5L_03495 [Streptomyces phyllanthi]|uniref:Secreted protein n=1 Tax=Streptomyces phyllanthi TaxID=1803180 RepID=A0A5N8VYB0_9ACTN|nr:hypothetical protein [Streptomyces phyllanthi]MPY39802.1 hypothetical protein [Streptomyces phyllanthi]